MEKSKLFGKFEAILACFLSAALLLCAACVWQQQGIAEKLIRLHVVANSDAEEDQAVKLAVRDAVLAQVEALCASASDVGQAAARIEQNLELLEQTAGETLQAAGYSYPAHAYFGTERFPTREYDSFSLPAGEYASLTIRLGEAQGKNWWCVVFPALCGAQDIEPVAEAAGLTPQQLRWIRSDGRVEVRFRLVEFYQKLISLFS